MEKEQRKEEKVPKANEDETKNYLAYVFDSLQFLTLITPEDRSISDTIFFEDLKTLKPEFYKILGELLYKINDNRLVKRMALPHQYREEKRKTKEVIEKEAKEKEQSIYRKIFYPEEAPTLEDLRDDVTDFDKLIKKLFNTITDHKEVPYLKHIVSYIINTFISFEPNSLLILLSKEASYYLNSNLLQAIIVSYTQEQQHVLAENLKNSDQLREKILSIIISKDKTYLESLIDQSSADAVITIHKILKMAIEYGTYFMAEFALEQWSLYFKTHELTKESYRELVSLVGHALIRSNTQICLLLTQPEIWRLYREEDQLRLLELVMYRTGNKNDKSTRKILISNMKANGSLNLELCQRIPAKTEYQRKIIKAILDEYHAEILAEEAALALYKLEEEEKKEAENKKKKKNNNSKKPKKNPKEIKDPVKIDKPTEQEKDIQEKNIQVNIPTASITTQDIQEKNIQVNIPTASITTQDNSPAIQEELPLDNPKEKAKRKRKKPTKNVKAEVPQKIVTKEPETAREKDVTQEIDLIFGSFTGKEEEEPTFFNSSAPAQKIKSPDLSLREKTGTIGTFRYVIALDPSGKVYIKSFVPESNSGALPEQDTVKVYIKSFVPESNSEALPEQDTGTVHGLIYKKTQDPKTGAIFCRYFDPVSGLERIPEPGYGTTAKENNTTASTETTTPPTASTKSNKAGEPKADLAGGKKLAADNNSQPSYSLTVKLVVEFNLSLSSSLIYEEVENTEQDEYKESIEQVEQRLEDQSANIQFENIANEQKDSLSNNLHNNSFIPLLPSDKQEFSLPFLIIGDPLEAGKVLGMVENLNHLENIMI